MNRLKLLQKMVSCNLFLSASYSVLYADATGEPSSDDPQVKNDNDQGTDEQLNDHDAVDMDPSTAPDEVV